MKSRGRALFSSFFLGGFECSSHRRASDRKRLDVIAASRHDVFARFDYERLKRLGIRTIRDGLRWHLVETRPGEYDWSSFLPMLRASLDAGVEVIWDLFHYGWPDDLDLYSRDFVLRFTAFAQGVARVLRQHGVTAPFISPMNEISFVAWAGGDAAFLNPFDHGRGDDVKRQLVRATLASMDAVRNILPDTRFVHSEPAIHITADPSRPQDREAAEAYRRFQFQSLDMLCGREAPELGGAPEYIDIIGLNYYNNNQWIHNGRTLWLGDPLYRPFREILREFWERYGRPMFVSETGCEGDDRPSWFRYVCGEVAAAMDQGVDLQGVCLYPIANHPGWDDDRHCPNGLLSYANDEGRREVFQPLAMELRRQQKSFAARFEPEPELQAAG